MARKRSGRVVVALLSPSGGRVTVHPDRVGRYLSRGYRKTGEAPVSSDGDRPKGNASRDEWAAYADSLGVTYPEGATRDDIRALLED